MVLVVAVLAGALFGIVRAKMHKMPYQAVQIQHLWLVLAAYIPQFFIFFFPVRPESLIEEISKFLE